MADVLDDLVPPLFARRRLEALEAVPRGRERAVVVPRLPMAARLPGSDDHAAVERVERDQELTADPSGLLTRGDQALAHRGVPLRLRPFLQRDVRDDGHHGVTSVRRERASATPSNAVAPRVDDPSRGWYLSRHPDSPVSHPRGGPFP